MKSNGAYNNDAKRASTKDQGGSGVSCHIVERKKYRESVKYWMCHSSVLDSEPPSCFSKGTKTSFMFYILLVFIIEALSPAMNFYRQ